VMGQSTESHSTEVASTGMMPAGVEKDGTGSLPSPQSSTTWLEPQQAAGAGLAALAAGILYWLWPALKGGVLGLFSRLREPELLQSPQRRRIMDVVNDHPGIHFKELVRRSGIPNGSLVHHVRQLEGAGLLVAKQANGYTCYFGRGPADAARASVLKADGARQVLAAVQASPGLSGLEVAHLTGLQPSTVNYHAKRLADAGLLSPVRDGRAVRLHPRTDASATKA
jgi:DNA-binding transcriptional ArsR family regulator